MDWDYKDHIDLVNRQQTNMILLLSVLIKRCSAAATLARVRLIM